MTSIALVQTGRRKAKTLKSVISHLQTYLPGLPIYLITDDYSHFTHPDITTVTIQELGTSDPLRELQKVSKVPGEFRDGFWLRVLSRHFYLAQLSDQLGDDDWLHVENDCLSLITPQVLREMQSANVGIAVPFESRGRAIPVVVHAKNKMAFNDLCQELLSASQKYPRLLDMDVWAAAAANRPSLFTPLPTMPNADWAIEPPPALPSEQKEFVPADWQWKESPRFSAIFDAAALGQLIGGQDPHNQQFQRRPGHRHESSWLNVRALEWRVTTDAATGLPQIQVRLNDSAWVTLANLHMHCKQIPDLEKQRRKWDRLIEGVNGESTLGATFAWDLLLNEIRSDPRKAPRLMADLIYSKATEAKSRTST